MGDPRTSSRLGKGPRHVSVVEVRDVYEGRERRRVIASGIRVRAYIDDEVPSGPRAVLVVHDSENPQCAVKVELPLDRAVAVAARWAGRPEPGGDDAAG